MSTTGCPLLTKYLGHSFFHVDYTYFHLKGDNSKSCLRVRKFTSESGFLYVMG